MATQPATPNGPKVGQPNVGGAPNERTFVSQGVGLTEPNGQGAPEPAAVASIQAGQHPAHVLHAAALMVVEGARYEDIEQATGVKVRTLRSWVTEGRNEGFQRILTGYREATLKRASEHRWRLGKMVDASYLAIERALTQEEDYKVAKDTAWELMDRVFPQRTGPDVNVNVGFQSVSFQQEINQTFNRVGEKFAHLLGALTAQDPKQYLRDQASDTYVIPTEVETPQESVRVSFTDGDTDNTEPGEPGGEPGAVERPSDPQGPAGA